MYQEIIKFIDNAPSDIMEVGVTPPEGLYLFLELSSKGELLNRKEDGTFSEEDMVVFSRKDDNPSPVIKERVIPYWLKTQPVSPAKIFNPSKKIFGNTCSPFAFSFTKKNFEKYNDLSKIQKEYKDETLHADMVEDKFREFMRGEIEIYFSNAEHFVEKQQHKEWMKLFRNYLYNNLFDLLNSLEEYDELATTKRIYVFLTAPDLEDFDDPYASYLSEKVFNKDKYNSKHPNEEGRVYGVSDSLLNLNEKKIFLQHLTGPSTYSFRITGKEATKIWQFYQLQKRLPKVLPLFIEKEELTNKAIRIFNAEGGNLNYRELIRKLLHKEGDLGNYYLLRFDNKEGKSRIVDIDLVSNFEFELNGVKVKELFSLGGKFASKINVKNIFDFEEQILDLMFDNKLIQSSGGRMYFKELKPEKMKASTFQNLMKYRKAVFDYVYKSRRKAITGKIFHDIMQSEIIEDLRKDELKDGRHTKGYILKEKLNLWFSLYEYFDYIQFDKPFNNETMVNKTERLMKRVAELVEEDGLHLQNDEEFAFSVGQVVYYLLSQSKSGNRTHALLEPFLQKSDVNLLKREIARCFDMYKHELVFYPNKYAFDKLMSEVMGYQPDETNMKNLMPFILAGYFAESKLYKKRGNNDKN